MVASVPAAPAQGEVRRCAKCGQTAVTLVFEWSHSYFGARTGSTTRDYRCQACGAKFSLYPRPNLIGLAIAGVVLLPACLMGVIPLWMAWSRWKADERNPVVPYAPMPGIRYRGGPPLRRCGACTGIAAAVKITRSTHTGIPTGTEYVYRCSQCGRGFATESLWGHLFTAFAATVVLAIAVSLLRWGNSPGWQFGGGGAFLLIGAFVSLQSVNRLWNRVRNPAE